MNLITLVIILVVLIFLCHFYKMYYAQSSFGDTTYNDIVHLKKITDISNSINDKRSYKNYLKASLINHTGTSLSYAHNTIHQLSTDIANLVQKGKDEYNKLSSSKVNVVNHSSPKSSINVKVFTIVPGVGLSLISNKNISYNGTTIISMKPTDTLTMTSNNNSKTYTFLNIFGTTTGPQQKRVLTFNSASSVSISTTIPVTSS